MNEHVHNKLSEVVGANNIAYLLKDNKDFSVTGYKVMKNQNSTGLLRCAQIMYNGKIKLVYLVDGYKPLSYVATRLGVNELNAVVFNLIQRAMDIKANGFFKTENIELDFNKIFVDTSDYSVHLLYYPLSSDATAQMSPFDNELRLALINLFNSFPVFNAPQFQRLCSELSNGALSLDMMLKKLQENLNSYKKKEAAPAPKAETVPQAHEAIAPDYGVLPQGYQAQPSQMYQNQPYQGGGNPQPAYPNPRPSFRSQLQNFQNQLQNLRSPQPQGYQNQQPVYSYAQQPIYQEQQQMAYSQPQQQQEYNAVAVQQPVMTITAINSPVQLVLTVDVPEYLIGKNPTMVNGAVTYNPAISRVHCKIFFNAGKYYVADMGSANGTFVNQQRLDKNQTVEINSGDYLKLANSDFVITF